IAGATIYLRELALLRTTQEPTKQDYTDILAQTTADASGRFAFKDVAADAKIVSPSSFYRHPWNLIVTAKGYGIAWHIFQSRSEQSLALVMRPETRLNGRLLDSNGKPAVGVHVQLAEIDERLDPELRYRAGSPDRLEL